MARDTSAAEAIATGAIPLREAIRRSLQKRAKGTGALALQIGAKPLAVLAELKAMADDGVAGRSRREGTWHVRAVPPAPVSGVRLLPVLEAGYGERRADCEQYAGCLNRFVRAEIQGKGRTQAGAKSARCPAGCADYAEVSRAERLAEAMASTDMGEPVFPPAMEGG